MSKDLLHSKIFENADNWVCDNVPNKRVAGGGDEPEVTLQHIYDAYQAAQQDLLNRLRDPHGELIANLLDPLYKAGALSSRVKQAEYILKAIADELEKGDE